MKLPKLNIYPPQGYRKWWLGAAALVLSALFVLLGFLTGEQWNIAIGLVLGLGGFSNVMEWRERRKGGDGS